MRIAIAGLFEEVNTFAVETMGLWTGEEDRDFSIGGGTRTYHGAGALLGLDQIVMQTGLTVRMQRVSLAPIAAEVAQLLRGYDAGLAPAEIHRALFDPMSGDLVAEPKRLWKGVIDTAPIHTAEIGGQSTVDVAEALAAGGTEPRYRAGYEVTVDKEPAAVIEDLLRACLGQVAEVGGQWKLRVGGAGASPAAVAWARAHALTPSPTNSPAANKRRCPGFARIAGVRS